MLNRGAFIKSGGGGGYWRGAFKRTWAFNEENTVVGG